MNLLSLVFLTLFFYLSSDEPPATSCKNSQYLLSQSKQLHDAKDVWEQTSFNVHIQEPRVSDPQRYSKVVINKQDNYFELERDSEEGKIKRTFDKGEFKAFLKIRRKCLMKSEKNMA